MELAYGPITNWEFAHVKSDPNIEMVLDQASLYIVAQRPIITFEKLLVNPEELVLEFEIHQRHNPHVLKCRFPYLQDVFNIDGSNEISLALNLIDKGKSSSNSSIRNVIGFSLVEIIDEMETRFVAWFSPEQLLYNSLRGKIDCKIDGDPRAFLRYKVHYVGRATKQGILQRLTGHSSLQDILSIENPLSYGDLPTHEIAILCFRFRDNLLVQTFGLESSVDEVVEALITEKVLDQQKVFLDAEKALIKAMNPLYNKILFKDYPKSKDGLYDENYNAISYTIMDPLTLEYPDGNIEGGLTMFGGDHIFVRDNETFELVKNGGNSHITPSTGQ